MADVTLKALLLGDDRSASIAMRGVAREIDKVVERLMTLSRMDATPEVKVKTAEAQAELARLQAEMKSLGTETETVGKKAEKTHGQIGAMATAIIGLGPALVPLAAGAVGLAAGWGAMGAAGILAFVGVRNEMQAGTATGQAFSAGMDTIKGDMRSLAAIAAAGVLTPFQGSVANLQGRMPVLSRMVGDFSVVTGKTAGNITNGLVSAFVALNPLMESASLYTLNLSDRWQRLMSGPGLVAFGSYVQSVLPQVTSTVESIVTAAMHLVDAFAPLGLGTLSELRMLSDVISAIPLDVLSQLAQLGGSVFLGFRTWQALQPLIAGVAKGLDFLSVSEDGVATATRGMQAAFGVVGVAVAALSLIFSANAESQRQNEQAANDYAEALRRTNGVVDESIRQMTAKKLADDGVLDAARQLGIALPDVTSAALGNADAQARVNAVLAAQAPMLKEATTGAKSGVQANTALGDAADKVTGAIGSTNTALDAGIQKNKDIAAATKNTATAASAQSDAIAALASQYGMSVPVYQAAVQAQQQQADSAAAATAKMQLENDAAGLLKDQLDRLNGKTISAADAQNAFDSSLSNMGTHVTATGKKIHFTTTSINDMSSASVALRGQLNGQVSNLQRVVEANGGLSGSTGKAREQMLRMRKQIIDNAVAHGVDRAAVTAYIDKLLKIPKKVPPTKLDTDKAAAERKAKEFIGVINGVPTWRSTTLSVNVVSNVNAAVAGIRSAIGSIGSTIGKAAGGPVGFAGGGRIPGFAAGTIVGAGTGTSDSIMAVNSLTGALLKVSNGEFISTASSTARNQAALEAGNRGATLAVAGVGAVSNSGRYGSAGVRSVGAGPLQPVIVQFLMPDGRVIQQQLLTLKRTQGGALGLA